MRFQRRGFFSSCAASPHLPKRSWFDCAFRVPFLPLKTMRTVSQNSLRNYPLKLWLPSCFLTPSNFLWSVEIVHYIHCKPLSGSHCREIPTEMKIPEFWSWTTTAPWSHSTLCLKSLVHYYLILQIFLHPLKNILFHLAPLLETQTITVL